MSKRRNVLILGFGGTIAMVPNAAGVLVPAKTVEEIVAIVPSLREMAEVSLREVENRDSTNINPSHWTKLAFDIAQIHGQYDGIIVTHGTDTMAYTAGAVSLVLGRKLRIPIVFTGAQLPLITHGTDARFNLEWAMRTINAACEEKICEVMIVFSDLVLRASRAIKISESHFRAFDSPAFPPLGRITSTGVTFIPEVFRDESTSERSPLDITPHFQRGILSVEVVPGLEPGILLEVLRSGKCQGILLKSLGAGNVPSQDEYSLLPVIEAAINTYKVPVLVSTKFVGGRTYMDVSEPGKLALDFGAIPTGDLTDVMAQVKFMWALAQGHRSQEDLGRIINTSIVGEITV